MLDMKLRMVAAGVCFGLYPLFLNRTALPGYVLSALFLMIGVIIVTPFAKGQFGCIDSMTLKSQMILFCAAAFASAGTLFMNSVTSVVQPQKLSNLIVLMIIVQTIVNGIYGIIMAGKLELKVCAGYACAALAVYLINQK